MDPGRAGALPKETKPFGRSERAEFGDDLFAHDPNLFSQIG
jgi:hypothetical protein